MKSAGAHGEMISLNAFQSHRLNYLLMMAISGNVFRLACQGMDGCVCVWVGDGGGHTPKTTRAASISMMLIKKSSNEANCPPVLPNCWPAYEFVVFVGTLLAAVRAHPLGTSTRARTIQRWAALWT